uniref:Protein with signal anchor n=1 Tax=Anopheles atroparvus TaxID=41427 RepID=A0AAG5D136_ANOAO
MDVFRKKLFNLSGIQATLGLCKAVGYYASLLLVILSFTLWFDFRPFGMICAVALGVFWCCHRATLQLQKSVHLDQVIAKIEDKFTTLHSSSPIRLRMCLAGAGLTLIAPFHFFPLWMIFATVLALIFFFKWKYEIQIVMNHESVLNQETQLDLDVQDFLPEINEINQSLLQEIDEQCYDPSEADFFVQSNKIKNAAEEDEEVYLNMLIPEVDSNYLDSADQSASSSDEMFCPESIGKFSTLHSNTRPTSSEIRTTTREKHIEFKVSHFNANSSSDSDDNISRGLCFSSNDDDMQDGSRLNNQLYVTGMDHWHKYESAPRYDMMSVSRLASNVLVDTVYKHILDTTSNHHQSQLQQDISAGSVAQNPVFPSINNNKRPMRLSTLAKQKKEDSTDEDVESDFEILNSDELKNL